jgi:hypothetical protein
LELRKFEFVDQLYAKFIVGFWRAFRGQAFRGQAFRGQAFCRRGFAAKIIIRFLCANVYIVDPGRAAATTFFFFLAACDEYHILKLSEQVVFPNRFT